MDEKTSYILEEIDDVKEIMFDNVQKINMNVVQLEELDIKAQQTKELAESMRRQSTILKTKEWWKNVKVQMILASILFAVVAIIILAIVMNIKN